MNILSLFDWISCARVALDRAEIPVDKYFASEVDKYAIQIAKKNYSDTVCVGDVKWVSYGSQLYWKTEKGSLNWYHTRIDLIIGWSPCQDLSIAKKDRKWLEWSKSSLFREYVRILREVKPKWFILENVNSMPKKDRDIITRELGVDPIMINAALVSAQNRKRLFRTNIPWVTQPGDRWILLKDIIEDIPITDPRRKKLDKEYIESLHSFWDHISELNHLWKVRQWYEYFTLWSKLYSLTVSHSSNRRILIMIPKKSVCITASYAKKNAKNYFKKSEWQIIIARDDVLYFYRKLTPGECLLLQWLPMWYNDWVSNSQSYKLSGNAFNIDVMAHILSFIPDQCRN